METADFEEILALVRTFVRDTVVPLEMEIDRTDEIPAAVGAAARQMGLFGFALPERYGGLGLSMEEEVRLVVVQQNLPPSAH